MHLSELPKHIRTLLDMEETDAPVVSFYLNLAAGRSACRCALYERASALQESLPGDWRGAVEQGLARIEPFLETGVSVEAKGLAAFARGGERPFFLPLQFRLPLPDSITVAPLPGVFHLVGLERGRRRYVIVLVTRGNARLFEVNLGPVTSKICARRPELSGRLAREWTPPPGPDAEQDGEATRIVACLERLLSGEIPARVVIVGDPRATAPIRALLPESVKARIMDLSARERNESPDMRVALRSFVERKKRERGMIAGSSGLRTRAAGVNAAGSCRKRVQAV